MTPRPSQKAYKSKRLQPERGLHSVVADWLDLELDERWALWFPIPNAANFNPIVGAMLKRTKQIKPGVHDICVMWRMLSKGTGVVFIELKVKPNKPTDDQITFGHRVTLIGGVWKACYSLQEVREFLSMLSVPMKGRVLS